MLMINKKNKPKIKNTKKKKKNILSFKKYLNDPMIITKMRSQCNSLVYQFCKVNHTFFNLTMAKKDSILIDFFFFCNCTSGPDFTLLKLLFIRNLKCKSNKNLD